MRSFLKVVGNRQGATAIEFALIAGLIAVAAVGAFKGLGSKLSSTFNNTSAAL